MHSVNAHDALHAGTDAVTRRAFESAGKAAT
jgi:hypothetical protein